MVRGQSYDGASNMSGVYNGLQAKLKEHSKNAFYIWCSSHRLNLVLANAANCIPEAKTFFGVLEQIYTILTASHKRFAMLELCLQEHNVKSTVK